MLPWVKVLVKSIQIAARPVASLQLSTERSFVSDNSS